MTKNNNDCDGEGIRLITDEQFCSWEPSLGQLAVEVDAEIQPLLRRLEQVAWQNHRKVLRAFQQAEVGEHHFQGTTGYGYGDQGRATLDRLFAQVMGAEAALVRTQFVSGTHAIALCYGAILRPGDRLLAIGRPYDSLEPVTRALVEQGIKYDVLDLLPGGQVDWAGLQQQLEQPITIVSIQRSRGYSWRPALAIPQLGEIISAIKTHQPSAVCFVDNCYGEFVAKQEPPEVGADLIAGSLIKNPGGGLAPCGAYVAGKQQLVRLVADRLTAPGLGANLGATLGFNRQLFQGLYLAPHAVGQALQGAVFTARLLQRLGFAVSPGPAELRSDIIQGIRLGSPAKMLAFCRGLQRGSPVDSTAIPEPALLPGYQDRVIMAGGTFIQGASLELSADGPLRAPYAVYLQGGLSYHYCQLGVLHAVDELHRRGLIP